MSTLQDDRIARCLDAYRSNKHVFSAFAESIVRAFQLEPTLIGSNPPIVHSMRYRLKDESHLADKIRRKETDKGVSINQDNLFNTITDLAGVRVLHLYQRQFSEIDKFIRRQIVNKEWFLLEKPIAYYWDPDSTEYFKTFDLKLKIKPSHYTSIHYVIKPRRSSIAHCEIQVRTLLEEVWGEIDHSINYPHPTDSKFTKEQLRVLSKLVSAGSRLADSIFSLDQ